MSVSEETFGAKVLILVILVTVHNVHCKIKLSFYYRNLWHKSDSEEAPQVVGTRPRGNLEKVLLKIGTKKLRIKDKRESKSGFEAL